MRWGAQALHVAAKDVRMTRWLIAGYVLLVWTPPVMAALRGSVEVGHIGLTLLTMFGGLLLVATVIQADSPARSDAFWVTRPLDPTAVLAGKLLYALVVPIGIALPAQAAGFALHDVAASHYPAYFTMSIVIHGSMLVIGVAFATLTKDLRGFIVALVALYLALLLGAMLREAVTPAGSEMVARETTSTGTWSGTVFFILMLLIAVHQYHTRRVRRGALLAIGLVAFWSITGPALPRAALFETSAPSMPQELRAEVRGELEDRSADFGQSGVMVRLRAVGGAPDHEYVLRGVETAVHRADGTVDPLESPSGRILVLRAPSRSPVPGSGQFFFLVSDAQMAELRQGTARLAVDGVMTIRAPEPLGSFPVSGGTIREGGLRIGRVRFSRPRGGDSIQVATAVSTIGDTCDVGFTRGSHSGGCSTEFMLIDGFTGDTTTLQPAGSSGGSVGLAMVGPPSMFREITFRPALEVSALVPDSARLRNSRIAAVRWRDVGSYPVSVEAAIRH